MNKKIGIQLFTLRDEAKQNFDNTLKKIADLGYEGVEFAGYFGDYKAKELRTKMETLGLENAGSHIPYEILKNDLEAVIAYQKEAGSNSIVCPIIPEEKRTSIKGYEEVVEVLNNTGKLCKKHDIYFSYHNHAFELTETDGIIPLEYILQQTNAEWVQAELDVYWLKKAGHDPVEWLDRYKNRMKRIHIKDMTMDGEQFFAELGTGGLDVENIIKHGEQSSAEWFIVEQDKTKKTAFESAAISMEYLKNIAVKYKGELC
ncbi:sugar phosphate isomerase/epimerase [Sinobaca sp. H24]|uniref:sugar phosphate isomerase/epimerase family protein n=1 Tax=Sinobaca sp. H24 TaxID=2923376 RepID=UPI002079B463|nr:sugar phosphate isomerase/epimerase [Sinobaca sp. H24]